MLAGQPPQAIAQRLGTSAAMIAVLESGRVADYPREPEIGRLVLAYASLVRVDPRPLLERISALRPRGLSVVPPTVKPAAPPSPAPEPAGSTPPPLPAGASAHPDAGAQPIPQARPALFRARARTAPPPRAPAPAAPAPDAAPAAADAGAAEAAHAPAPRRWRHLRAGLAVLVVLAAAGGVMVSAPSLLYRGVAALPEPLRTLARIGADQLVLMTAPARDGLIWIELADPRLRKADKLPGKSG